LLPLACFRRAAALEGIAGASVMSGMGHKQKAVPGELLAVATPWREFVMVCGKCSRKLDGGFGPDGGQTLRSALKDSLREQGRRREVRVVEGGCFGLCPKGGVAVAHGAVPGVLLVVPGGAPAAGVIERLSRPGAVPES